MKLSPKARRILLTIILAGLLGHGILFLTACVNEQQAARRNGGLVTINLPPDTKLEYASWRGEDIWYTYRTIRPNERAENHTMKESSALSSRSGTVVFVESRTTPVTPIPTPTTVPQKLAERK